jgi:hypothetical protein
MTDSADARLAIAHDVVDDALALLDPDNLAHGGWYAVLRDIGDILRQTNRAAADTLMDAARRLNYATAARPMGDFYLADEDRNVLVEESRKFWELVNRLSALVDREWTVYLANRSTFG